MSFTDLFLSVKHHLKDHPEQTFTFYPSSTAAFSCKQCAQCCQQSWEVPVTERYYRHWAPILEGKDPERFTQAFRLSYENSKDPLAYAHIRRHPDQRCVFLDSDNLCFLQKSFGHEALPQICQVYPRLKSTSPAGNYTSHALSGSCSKAADLLSDELNLSFGYQPRAPQNKNPSLLLNETQTLDEFDYLSFLGLVLDLIQTPKTPSLKHLQTLVIETLAEFISRDNRENWCQTRGKNPQRWAERVQFRQSHLTFEPSLALRVWEDFVPLKGAEMTRYFMLLVAQQKHSSQPSPELQSHLFEVVRHLWVGKMCVTDGLVHHQFTLAQEYLWHVVTLSVIQIWVGAELFHHQKIRHLPSLINRTEVALTHRVDFFDRIKSLPTQDCLRLMRHLNQWSLF